MGDDLLHLTPVICKGFEITIAPAEEEVGQIEEAVQEIPMFNVVLLDDDDHTYEYVIEMLMHIFGHSQEKAYGMAVKVDRAGRVVVDTTTKERAELKRDQIHSYGADWRIEHCRGSMSRNPHLRRYFSEVS